MENIKVNKLEKENTALKLRLNILNQLLILDDCELMYLNLLIDEIKKHNKEDR